MHMSPEEYQAYVQQKARPSPMGKNMLWAFLVGGGICLLGQGLHDLFVYWQLPETAACTASSLVLISLSAILTGFGVFDDLAKHAGAGTLVPITGFANAVVSPALEFRQEGVVTGTAVKLFTVAGPVLVFGISTSIVVGFVLYLLALL